MGKIFLSIIMMLSVLAQAKPSSRLQQPYQGSAQELVDAMNVVYPDLQLAVVQPATEAQVFIEIEALKAAIAGEQINGSLMHLACCDPRCGADRRCK